MVANPGMDASMMKFVHWNWYQYMNYGEINVFAVLDVPEDLPPSLMAPFGKCQRCLIVTTRAPYYCF